MWPIMVAESGWSIGEVLGAFGTLIGAIVTAIVVVWKYRDQSATTAADLDAKAMAARLKEFEYVLGLYKTERKDERVEFAKEKTAILKKLDGLQSDHLQCRQMEATLRAENAAQQREIDHNRQEITALYERVAQLESRVNQ